MTSYSIIPIRCLLACVVLLATVRIGAAQRRGDKPNIVIIMADDLDAQQLSCYGGKNLKTNHIDALAASGVQAPIYASSAMCVPTRASLFTGLYPMRHGAFQNHKPVYDTLKSVAHYLGDLGYRVGLTGKITSPNPSVFSRLTSLKVLNPSAYPEQMITP